MQNNGQSREYKIEEVDISFSQFTQGYMVKDTHEPVLCMIEGCKNKADWQVNIITEKNRSILICMKHHGEAGDKGVHGSSAMKYVLGEAKAKKEGT